ncbi:MAG: hypothetical protein NVS3B2_09580 [Ramlibacter sp.]
MNKLLFALLTGFIVSAANAQITVVPAASPVVAGSTTVTTTTKSTRIGNIDAAALGTTATTTRTTRSTTVANDARVMGAPATVTTMHAETRVGKPCPPGLAKKKNGCTPPGLAPRSPRD